MEEKGENKVEKVKLAKEIVVLLTVIFGLVLLVLQSTIERSPKLIPNDEKTQNSSDNEMKERKTTNTTDRNESNEVVIPETRKEETIVQTPPVQPSIQVNYDTIEVFIPSDLKIDEAQVDGNAVSILQFLPTKIKVLVEEKNTSQVLMLKSNTYLCSLKVDFVNGARHSVNLQQNCDLLPN